MNSKQSSTSKNLSIRFSGEKQLIAIEEIQSFSTASGIKWSECFRNMLILGWECYKNGATLGFDGKVVMPSVDETTNKSDVIADNSLSNKSAKTNSTIKPSKKTESSFYD